MEEALLLEIFPGDLVHIIIKFVHLSFRWMTAQRKDFIIQRPDEDELEQLSEQADYPDDFHYDVEFLYQHENKEHKPESIYEAFIEHSGEPIELENEVEFRLPVKSNHKLVVCQILSTGRGYQGWDMRSDTIGCVYGFELDGKLEWNIFEREDFQSFSEYLRGHKLHTMTLEEFFATPCRLLGLIIVDRDTFELLIYDEDMQHTDKPSLGEWAEDICEQWIENERWDRFLLLE